MDKTACSTAFEYSAQLKTSPECTHKVAFQCIVCQSRLSNECWISQNLNLYKLWNENVFINNEKGDLFIHESSLKDANPVEFTAKLEKYLPKLCDKKINLIRVCSPKHVITITCYQLLEVLMKKKVIGACKSPIDRVLPCKHIVSVSCSEKSREPPPACNAKVDNTFVYSCGLHESKINICSDLTRLTSTNPICKKQITCARFRCGHQVSIPCNLKKFAQQSLPGEVLVEQIVVSDVQYCEAEREIKEACSDKLNYKYALCGHVRKGVKCAEAFAWAADNEKQPACKELVSFTNPICGHVNRAACNDIDTMNNQISFNQWNPIEFKTQFQLKIVEYVLDHDENNVPIHGYCVREDSMAIKPPKPHGLSKETLICNNMIELIRTCGHTLVTTCSNVCWQKFSPCDDLVSIECAESDCKHKRSVPCHVDAADKRAGKKQVCKNVVSRICKRCRINKVDVECSQVVIECNTKATAILACTHEVSWSCGTDTDPREDTAKFCQTCVWEKWEKLLKSDISFDQNKELIEQIKTKINRFFGDFEIETNQPVALPANFDNHNKSRQEIVDRFLSNSTSNDIKIEKPFPASGSIADLSFYELVFVQVNKEFVVDDKFYFESHPTQYGRGRELIQLNKAGLNSCTPADDGLIHVLVGAAYRFNSLPHSLPYCANLNKKGNQAANRISLNQKKAGFDCIQTTPDDSEVKKFIFWEPGACMQLSLIALKVFKLCQICLDYHKEANGYLCSKKHFLCWDCFEQHVTQASQPDAVGKCVNDQGDLLCPECSEIFALLDVAKESVPAKVFDMLNKLKSDYKIKKAVERALKDQEDRLRKEYENLMAIQDVEERDAERLRLDIIENILTLRCPRCKCAFIDYSGCAALTCSFCNAGFCALCLKDCGGDAHAHVPGCDLNPERSMFITYEKFNQNHSIRRQNLILNKLKNHTPKVKDLIGKKMAKDFRDLNIAIQFNTDNNTNQTAKKSNSFFDFFNRR